MDIKTYWGIFRNFLGILSHIYIYWELCTTITYTTVSYSERTYLEPNGSSKACQTCKLTEYNQSLNIVRTFRNVQKYLCIFILTHRRATRADLHCPFLKNNLKKWSYSEKTLIVFHFWLNFAFKTKLHSCAVFYFCFWRNVYWSTLVLQNLPWNQCLTVFWIRLCLDHYPVICIVTLYFVLHQTHLEFWNIQNSI